MAVGRESAVVGLKQAEHTWKRPLRLAYAHLYGDSDLHTHIRWRAIKRVSGGLSGEAVDVACGDGTITLEMAQRHPNAIIRGIDLDPEAIRSAESRRVAVGTHNVSFEVGDVSEMSYGTVARAHLFDVLEHIDDDEALLRSIVRAVQPGGTIIVSTPTPNYPRFFGRAFHEGVGHVRDGYWPDELVALLERFGCSVTSTRRYTRLPSSLCCAVYYRYLWSGRLGFALSPFLNAVSFLDSVWPWGRGASSVLVVATRRADPDGAAAPRVAAAA